MGTVYVSVSIADGAILGFRLSMTGRTIGSLKLYNVYERWREKQLKRIGKSDERTAQKISTYILSHVSNSDKPVWNSSYMYEMTFLR